MYALEQLRRVHKWLVLILALGGFDRLIIILRRIFSTKSLHTVAFSRC